MPEPAKPSWRILLRTRPYLRAHRLWVGLTVACAAFFSAVTIGTSYLTKALTDAALAGQQSDFVHLLYVSSGLFVIYVATQFTWRHAASRFRVHVTRDLRHRLAEHVQGMQMTSLDRFHSGDLAARMGENVTTFVDYLVFVAELVYQPLKLAASIVFIGLINWKMLLIFGTITPLSAPLYDRISRPLQGLSGKLKADQARAGAVVEDAARGIHVLKAFNLYTPLARKYGRLVDAVLHNRLRVQRLESWLLLANQVLRYLPMLGSIVYGGYLTYLGEMSVGGLLAISTTMLWFTAEPIESLLELIRRTREVVPIAERIYEVLDQPAERAGEVTVSRQPDSPAIALRGVSFAYDGETRVLDGLSLEIEENEVVALVGPSGCGKSTVLRLLCGLYEPSAGSVSVYGNRLDCANPAAIRRWLSIVAQDTYLFPVSVAENVGYGRPGATRDEIVAAARTANADRFVARLADAYETPLREEAVNLSGGQRQCLAIARAVLKDAPILLLDEPTAALDTQSEATVQEALDRFTAGRTVLLVAHRLSTLRDVDRILVLNEGRIVEQGTHEQLMSTDGLYRRLYTRQIGEPDAHGRAGIEEV